VRNQSEHFAQYTIFTGLHQPAKTQMGLSERRFSLLKIITQGNS
jgi:hypothetical protein